MECKKVIADSRGDLLNAITTMDRLDGGISVLLHVPGSRATPNLGVEDVTVDVVVPPHELAEAGKDFSRAVAIMIQEFGCEIALPYLKCFQEQCIAEDVIPPLPLAAGKPIDPEGSLYLPSPEPLEGVLLRCCCRPGNLANLVQDFAIVNLPPRQHAPNRVPIIIASSDSDDHCQGEVQKARNHVKLRRTQRDSMVDDGFSGAIVSLGPCTDAVIDRFAFKVQEIPKLCRVIQSERSGKWEEKLHAGEFRYSFEQASTMLEALKADLDIERVTAQHIV
ncbi:hypothetical protein DXG01_016435 [Tephrocybe rancida]|nr:hypothetical protein DXG01_016435 [Tephrocybe rancida]